MKPSGLPRVVIVLFLIASFALLLSPQKIQSVAGHVVISEVQIAGNGDTEDEFIELYNPTESAVDISTWSIQRETSGGGFARKNFVSPAVIPSHGYFLVAHTSYNGIVSADMPHGTFTMATGATVFLVNNQVTLTTGDEQTIVDKVGLGTTSLDPENTAISPAPGSEASIERKSLSTSISTAMEAGGVDEFHGNGEDTDNNANDFITRTVSDPQNSASGTESIPTPSSTLTPTVTPTPTISPTATPTNTPSPMISPTPTPTPSSTPTPEETPTPTPEQTVTPTPTEVPSVTPTATPTTTPTDNFPPFRRITVSCNVSYHIVVTKWFTIKIPRLRCDIVRI